MTTPRIGPLGILSGTGNMLYRDSLGNITEVDTAGGSDDEILTIVGGVPVWTMAQGGLPPGYINGLDTSRNAANPTFQVDIAVGDARSDDNTENIDIASILTADITASGANGLDTGVEASSTWYSIWIIADSTDVAADASLLSISSTAPTLPAGYDIKRRVGWVFNNSTSNFRDYTNIITEGRARRVRYDEIEDSVLLVLSGGAATTFTNVDISAFVPPTSLLGELFVAHEGGQLGDGVLLRADGDTVSVPAIRNMGGSSGGTDSEASSTWLQRCSTAQIIEYANIGTFDETDIWATGYVDEL